METEAGIARGGNRNPNGLWLKGPEGLPRVLEKNVVVLRPSKSLVEGIKVHPWYLPAELQGIRGDVLESSMSALQLGSTRTNAPRNRAESPRYKTTTKVDLCWSVVKLGGRPAGLSESVC
ncbi:hypothetical protein EYF80_010049 [Liparis tanakae]|uniref:Uncharacterized protein n=1 Tax=Liparis tanakae TaxID=230148 RepID=A0A4Z2IP42_9TELE|nr:hypothetical protein EYF80_010049 [Liparis tanakae]